ncbi:MAG: hypothetical protein HYV28_00930 [Ignavibacteriales bacterium]|nr:hypothetical protein [Ignavibacteriales bacterium]
MNSKKLLFISCMLLICSMVSYGQIRDSKVHRRGMLHQTVYNTGEIARGWMTGAEGSETSLPLMEWPPYSKVVIDGKTYSGQHNSIGAGVHIAANEDGNPGQANRLFSFCGAVGSSTPEVAFGRWSFPYDFASRIENYPILSDGSLNTSYNPNEAEEIIKASWATNIGIMVNRTSRTWSYPDFDDLIIYEYEFIYNGDTDGNPSTIERTKTLKDVDFSFVYGLGPSMYGYVRYYDSWSYAKLYKGDQDMFFDSEYWLTFNMDRQTNQDSTYAGKPERDSSLFGRFARTGENGGGLGSPQAPGFCVMYFDTTHLARVYGGDTVLNESEYGKSYSQHMLYSFESHKLKQPWTNRIQTGDINSIKQSDGELNATSRSVTPYSATTTPVPATVNRPPYETQAKRDAYKAYWAGRAPHQISNTTFGIRKNINFAPYTVRLGDTIRFTIAEVVGYGAEPYKPVEGGRDTTGKGATNIRWNSAPHWYKKVYSFAGNDQKIKVTDNYLAEFGYPDYVNSNVRNVMQVAHKAYQAYTGLDSVTLKSKLPIHPEEMPRIGKYGNIPVPCPAPGIIVANTDTGAVILTWKRDAEYFSSPRLTGVLTKYNVYRSISGMGPWHLLGSVTVGNNLDSTGKYRFVDEAPDFKIGTNAFYAVTSVDDKGNQSGKSNLIRFQKNLGAVAKMGKVYAVPNPFIGKSGYSGTGEVDDKIGFYSLPEKCTIRIFSFAGNLVETIEHDANLYTEDYFQITKNGQEAASGIYFYIVTTPGGDKYSGKFVIIK